MGSVLSWRSAGTRRGRRSTSSHLVAHLSRWLASQGLAAGELVPERVEQFLTARRAAGYTGHLTLRGLSPLLSYLRGLGVVPDPPPHARTPS